MTMANNNNNEIENRLWDAADELRVDETLGDRPVRADDDVLHPASPERLRRRAQRHGAAPVGIVLQHHAAARREDQKDQAGRTATSEWGLHLGAFLGHLRARGRS